VDIQAYIQSGIIESYVLGLTTAEETADIERLRIQFPEVEQAIEEFSIMLEEQAQSNAIAPPANVKAKIMAAIRDEEPGLNVSPVAPLSKNEEGSPVVHITYFRKWRMVAAASVILLITSAALNYYLYNKYAERNNAYQALLSERNALAGNNQVYQAKLREWQSAAEMMADTAMAMVSMKDPAHKQPNLATVFWDTRNKDVYIMANKLPQPGTGKQYQLWALVDGKPVDAGLLDPQCTGACKMKNIPKAQAFAITLENQGGSPTPTSTIYVMGNV
jgi:anti-sigma-K factor RskA